MILAVCPVSSLIRVGSNIFVLGFSSREIASSVSAGQFVNIKVREGYPPFLRRPFSVYRVEGDLVEIIFDVIGKGTALLADKQPGDSVDVLGPLGRSYNLDGDFVTAVLVAGGMGVAPLPMVTRAALDRSKSVVTFLGARTKHQLVTSHLANVSTAADDGSEGFHGTVVDLLRSRLLKEGFQSPKIFACGPNRMLKNLADLANEFEIPCEASLESVMACGIGICQGCPVEMAKGDKKYSLICKDGTVFDARMIKFS